MVVVVVYVMLSHPPLSPLTLQGLGHTPSYSECSVHVVVMLLVTITPLLGPMEGTCHGQVCIVVLGAHQVLSVPAALGICVGYMCVLCVLGAAHLVLICVGYMYSGALGAHLVQEGSGSCKKPNFAISYRGNTHIFCGTYTH